MTPENTLVSCGPDSHSKSPDGTECGQGADRHANEETKVGPRHVEFMVLGMPRSGTTWAANWLTTDTTICIHDPLARYLLHQIDAIKSAKTIGVACTGLVLMPAWLNSHPARKVILHRPFSEVKLSLDSQGFVGFQPIDLDAIQGTHCDWRDLFTKPKPIYEFLTDKPFDAERHAELAQMNVQVDYERVQFSKEAATQYMSALQRALN